MFTYVVTFTSTLYFLCIFKLLSGVLPFQLEKTSFSISYRAGLLVMNSLRMSKFLKYSFAGYRILFFN